MGEEVIQRRETFKNWFDQLTRDGLSVDPIKFRSTDVLIMGCPKSGTTWLQQMSHQIRTRGDEDFSDIYDVTRMCPMYITGFPGYQIDGEQKAFPRIFKGHSGREIIPLVEGMKIIVVLRDPHDAVWSFCKFASRWYGLDADLSLEGLKEMYSCSALEFLPPWGFAVDWYKHKNDPNVLWLHYEDMIKDLKFCVEKVAEFMGVQLSEAELERIRNFCTFDYMAARKEKFSGGEWLDALMCLPSSVDKWHPQIGMVRPDGGKVGQGGKDMPAEMKDFVTATWKETVGKSLGFDNYQQLYEQNSILPK